MAIAIHSHPRDCAWFGGTLVLECRKHLDSTVDITGNPLRTPFQKSDRSWGSKQKTSYVPVYRRYRPVNSVNRYLINTHVHIVDIFSIPWNVSNDGFSISGLFFKKSRTTVWPATLRIHIAFHLVFRCKEALWRSHITNFCLWCFPQVSTHLKKGICSFLPNLIKKNPQNKKMFRRAPKIIPPEN